MERKDFIKRGLAGFGAIVAIPTVLTSCTSTEDPQNGDCELSPSETAGPFVIKTPAELVRANIVSDRKGVALLITLTVQDQKDDCKPIAGALVDVWHCDSEGHYSEYENNGDFTDKDFLRGRQTTDANGQVSFITIYPGWYPGRAPHIHVEVFNSDEKSKLVTQVAFPDEISDEVYDTEHYVGSSDTNNKTDRVFFSDIEDIIGVVSGNITDGYTMTHTLTVKG